MYVCFVRRVSSPLLVCFSETRSHACPYVTVSFSEKKKEGALLASLCPGEREGKRELSWPRCCREEEERRRRTSLGLVISGMREKEEENLSWPRYLILVMLFEEEEEEALFS